MGLRALLAIIYPPLLEGNPISIINLHRQLTSPIEVLKNTIGDAPLDMKIVFNNVDEGRVQFDVPPSTGVDSENLRKRGMTSESDLNIPGSAGGSQDGFQDDGRVEEAPIFHGMQQRTPDQHQEVRTVSPASTSRERYSWRGADFIPVQIDYDRT